MTKPAVVSDLAPVDLITAAVRGCNALTVRWAAETTGADVLCAPGVWALLAALGAGASQPVAAELSTALGMSVEEAAATSQVLIQMLESDPDLRAAVALWAARTVDLYPDWMALVGAAQIGTLTGMVINDQSNLDRWANDKTDGLIPHFPLHLDGSELLILASAIAAKFKWRTPFNQYVQTISSGPWAGRSVDCLYQHRLEGSSLAVNEPTSESAVTLVRVPGINNVDVILFLGAADASPSRVLIDGLTALPLLDHSATSVPDSGPGYESTVINTSEPGDVIQLTAARWEVQAQHDLLQHPTLFGIQTAITEGNHFPGVAPDPLMIGAALQDAMARFDALGFEAAAVTAIGVAAGMFRPSQHTVRQYQVDARRPHGFAAILRPYGLVIFAGWVSDPIESTSAG